MRSQINNKRITPLLRAGMVIYDVWQSIRAYSLQVLKPEKKYLLFGIGYGRTGTTSLHIALQKLGYKSVHFWKSAHEPKMGWIKAIEISRYNAFTDAPFYDKDVYKKLDERFPQAKFILTVRNEQEWKKSWKKYFAGTPFAIDTETEMQELVNEYRAHNKEVQAYFKDRPDKLLIMDFPAGDSWDKLCPFLEEAIPNEKLPHTNKSTHSRLRNVYHLMR